MTTPHLALLHGGTFPALATLGDPALRAHRVDGLYVCDTDPNVLREYDVVLVADRLDPVQRAPFEPVLRAALRDAGKTVAVLGQNDVQDWLPGIGFSFRRPNYWSWRTGEDTGTRARLDDDPFWEHFSFGSLNWHNHGLLHPPAGSHGYVVVEEDGVEAGTVLYVDEVNQPGRLLVTTMDPIYHHGSGFMPGATQMLYSLLRWLVETRPDPVGCLAPPGTVRVVGGPS